MRYRDLDHFLKKGRDALTKGPIALILVEDLVEVDTTIRHHQLQGFREILVFAPDALDLPSDVEKAIRRIPFDTGREGATERAVNAIIAAAPGLWMYYCYNAEFLFFPFSENRTVGEMLAFHTEERRDAMLTYVVDLYATDLTSFPNAVSLEYAYFDRLGYYSLKREGADGPKDRQLDFFGGLRWRFEEHVPWTRRRIDRIGLFRAKPGLKLRADHTFNDEEYNTYDCGWHNNMTATICSFRTAKALRSNPGSKYNVTNLEWRSSTRVRMAFPATDGSRADGTGAMVLGKRDQPRT